jgi:hypothetical protein
VIFKKTKGSDDGSFRNIRDRIRNMVVAFDQINDGTNSAAQELISEVAEIGQRLGIESSGSL